MVSVIVWLGVALAVDWSPSTWRAEADRDGVLTLPAGQPLRLLDGPVEVFDADAQPVALRAGHDDWWIEPSPRTRYLRAAGARRVLVVDPRQERADWAAWEHDAARALATGAAVPAPPDGVGELSRRVEARARAVGAGVGTVGLFVDLAAHRGLSWLGMDGERRPRVLTLAAGATLAIDAVGVVTLGVRPITGHFERVAVELAGEGWDLASTGRFPVTRALYRAPGAPPLRVVGDPAQPVEVTVQEQRLRRWLTFGASVARPDDGLAAAEWDALHGLPVDFRPWLDDADPAIATWARIRAIERATGEQLTRLTSPAWPGDEAVAGAVLRRAADLPDEIVLAWRDALPGADPRTLAAWLDGQQAARPHGMVLLERAAASRPGDRALTRALVRHRALHTRRTPLPSDRDDEAEWRFSADGAGVPRLRVGAGEVAALDVVTPSAELRRAVRWTLAPETLLYVDGRPLTGEGSVHLALDSGLHQIEVERGEVLVSGAGWFGGEPGVGWRAVPLPATWALPGAGAPLELQVVGDGGSLTAVFDDGRVVSLPPGGGELRAGPHAAEVRIEGMGRAGVAARVLRAGGDEVALPLEDEALATIAAATAAIDAGDPRARSRRAAALAALAHRRLAWADVSALEDVDLELHRRAWTQVASTPVMTGLRGPLDPPTAVAMGDDRAAAALRAIEADARVEAVVLARGDEVLQGRAFAGLRWLPVQRVDEGAGLEPVTRRERPGGGTLGERVREALVRAPWPADESVEVRAGAVDRIVSARGPLTLELWCRDLTLAGRPCRVDVVGGEVPTVEVPDGGLTTLRARGGEVEVGPVGEDQVVVVRARAADGLLVPSARRLAVTVAGRARVRLPRDRLARIEVVRGQVEATSEPVGTLDGDAIVHPRGELVLRGEGAVLISVSDPLPPRDDEQVERPERPPLRAEVMVDDVWPTLPRPQHRVLPGGPSLRVGLAAVHTADGQFRERWSAAEVEAALLGVGARRWGFVELWARAPGGAGFAAEVGLRRGRALLSARGFGASTFAGDAGELGLRLHGRIEGGPPRAWLRVDLWPRAAWVSLQPRRAVDPRVWSRHRLIHFAGVDARVTALSEPTRDLRLRSFVEARSNAGVDLDRVVAGARADVLFARRTRVSGQVAVHGVFADAARRYGRVTPTAGVSADHDWWSGDRRWMLFAVADASPRGDLSLRAGVSVHATGGRGLRDPPPTQDLFRTEREGR